MSYVEQKKLWLEKHPRATPEEIWEAGYVTCLKNWCNKNR